jgi:hypothetical protein
MSEPVIRVMYGIPLSKTESGEDSGRTKKIHKMLEEGLAGIQSFYNGNAVIHTPAAFAIDLIKRYAGDHHTELDCMFSNKHQKEFNTMYRQLPEDIQKELKKFGSPRAFILWATE